MNHSIIKQSFLFSLLLISPVLKANIPLNYYTTPNGKLSAALKSDLHIILMQDTSRYYSYGSGVNHTLNGFNISDRDTINNLVIDMYSDSLRYFASDYITQNYPDFDTQI